MNLKYFMFSCDVLGTQKAHSCPNME